LTLAALAVALTALVPERVVAAEHGLASPPVSGGGATV
jgi:hypothetical protein